MTHQTIAQQRAKHALKIVCGTDDKPGFKGKPSASQKKLNSYIAGFGPMILMNGFGQACAFYLANNEEEHQDVYAAITQWLTCPGRPYPGEDDLMQSIVNRAMWQLIVSPRLKRWLISTGLKNSPRPF